MDNDWNFPLHDPFELPDGSRAETREAFHQNQDYLRGLLAEYVYGPVPPPPRYEDIVCEIISEQPFLGGASVMSYYVLRFDGMALDVRVHRPADAENLPVIMSLDYDCNEVHRKPTEDEQVLLGRYVFVTLGRKTICADNPAPGEYPLADTGLGVIGLWGYAASACLSYIERQPYADPARVAISGHSRDGKAAICAAVFDTRFAAVWANGSGCGGAGSFFVVGSGAEDLATITTAFPTWFTPKLAGYGGDMLRDLPVDMIFARAVIAPRHVLCTEAAEDRWANPIGTRLNTDAAAFICTFLGADTLNEMTVRPGQHDRLDEDWRTAIDFLDRCFW